MILQMAIYTMMRMTDQDQSMEDAVQIAKVTDNLAPLIKEELNSSDITYDRWFNYLTRFK